MNIHRLLAIALIASSVALVGCGGGGGGGGSKSSSSSSGNSTSNLPTPGQDDLGDLDDQNQGGSQPGQNDQASNPPAQNPDDQNQDQGNQNGQDDQTADIGEPSNPQLLLPVNDDDDQLALLPTGNLPGQIAANPEPATAALAAVGLAFLATRRFGRREA